MNVPIVLHGHCHNSVASNLYNCKFGSTNILTAGAFKKLDAATFSLVRVNNKWQVASQTLFKVNYLKSQEPSSL